MLGIVAPNEPYLLAKLDKLTYVVLLERYHHSGQDAGQAIENWPQFSCDWFEQFNIEGKGALDLHRDCCASNMGSFIDQSLHVSVRARIPTSTGPRANAKRG